jgi:hypothetical protein
MTYEQLRKALKSNDKNQQVYLAVPNDADHDNYLRVFGARMQQGRLQVRILSGGPKWVNARLSDLAIGR